MTEINQRQWVRLTRKKLGLTQGKLADIVYISQKHISEFERGDRFLGRPKMLQISRYFKSELIKTSDMHKEMNNLVDSLKDYKLTKTQASKEIFGSVSTMSYLQNNKKMLSDKHIKKIKDYFDSKNMNNKIIQEKMNKPNANNTQTAMNEILENYTDKHSIDVAIGKLTSCLMKIEQAENAYNEASKIINNHDSFKGNAEPQLFHTEFINNLIKELLFHKFMN